jgi:hypothetical protein
MIRAEARTPRRGGTDDVEVAVVEGGQLGGAEAFSDGDEAGVGAAEGKVGVAVDELGDSGPVVGGEGLDGDLAGGDTAVEGGFCGGAELP